VFFACVFLNLLFSYISLCQTWWEKSGQKYDYDLSGKRILIVLGGDFDYHETFVIKKHWEDWGAKVDVAGTAQELTGHLWKRTEKGWDRSETREVKTDLILPEIDLARYHALFLPGGNSPKNLLRTDSALVTRLIRQADKQGLVLGAICHGPLVLAVAGVLKGRAATGHTEIIDVLTNAGAAYAKRVYVVDRNIVTTNWPYFETTAVKMAQQMLHPEFLQFTTFIDSDNPAIRARAEELTAGCTTEAERAKKTFEYVRDSYNEVPCATHVASEVMRCGGNSCRRRSILLAALCRAVGIPARLHLQKVTIKDWRRSDGMIVDVTFAHGITGININGKWHLYEPVGNRDKWISWTQDERRGAEMPVRFYADRDCLFPSNNKIIIEILPDHFADRSDAMIKLIEKIDGDVRY
jgi:protease I